MNLNSTSTWLVCEMYLHMGFLFVRYTPVRAFERWTFRCHPDQLNSSNSGHQHSKSSRCEQISDLIFITCHSSEHTMALKTILLHKKNNIQLYIQHKSTDKTTVIVKRNLNSHLKIWHTFVQYRLFMYEFSCHDEITDEQSRSKKLKNGKILRNQMSVQYVNRSHIQKTPSALILLLRSTSPQKILPN